MMIILNLKAYAKRYLELDSEAIKYFSGKNNLGKFVEIYISCQKNYSLESFYASIIKKDLQMDFYDDENVAKNEFSNEVNFERKLQIASDQVFTQILKKLDVNQIMKDHADKFFEMISAGVICYVPQEEKGSEEYFCESQAGFVYIDISVW